MQTLTHQAQQTIEFQQQRLSPYMPLLGMAVAKTYLVPFGGLLIVNVISLTLMTALPGLFRGLIGSFASVLVFFAVLYYGWRYAERRWNGTSLFVAYTTVSKSRRTLQAEITSANPSNARIQELMTEYVRLVDALIDLLHNQNLVPEVYEGSVVERKEKLAYDDYDEPYDEDIEDSEKAKRKRS